MLTSFRFQAILVAVLLLGSLSALVFNVFTAIVPRERELQVQEQLREASHQMAVEAARWNDLAAVENRPAEEVDRELAAICQRALASHPNVEGGFYLGGDSDRFSGFSQGSARPPHPPKRPRNDPPPMEDALIRVQSQQTLSLAEGEFLLNIRDVGPSRVAVLTEPVGSTRPAQLATWVMFRLIDPRDLSAQVHRYQLSTGLALTALGAAMLLAWNLFRLIRRQNLERERLQYNLRRAEHLAALGMLLSGVAHEVRNPLAAIRSTVQLWQRLPDMAQNPGTLTAVIQAVDRINQIVSQLLHFSRADSDTREIVDLNQLLGEMLDLVSAQAQEQGVTIERRFDAPVAKVRASGQSLRQVFLNLATNALQAMPSGGTLHCSTEAAKGNIDVTIADTGPGVSVADRAHLFEPFFTTRAEGTGLGLAICREIVTQHDGQIELLSDTDPGATFRVTLPAALG